MIFYHIYIYNEYYIYIMKPFKSVINFDNINKTELNQIEIKNNQIEIKNNQMEIKNNINKISLLLHSKFRK